MRRSGFSSIEVLMAIVVLGLLAALALPRFGNAGERSDEAELRANLASLRTAIALYFQDHGRYPEDPAALVCQSGGRPSYLDQIPACPLGRNRGQARVLVIHGIAPPEFSRDQRTGWVYNADLGFIVANVEGTDSLGTRYDRY